MGSGEPLRYQVRALSAVGLTCGGDCNKFLRLLGALTAAMMVSLSSLC